MVVGEEGCGGWKVRWIESERGDFTVDEAKVEEVKDESTMVSDFEEGLCGKLRFARM